MKFCVILKPKNMNRKIIITLIIFGFINIHAQEVINTTGGTAYSNEGNVSYSVGQTVYSSYSNSNGSISQGVQQVYSIELINNLKIEPTANIVLSVFPNPTIDNLKINVINSDIKDLSYCLYDLNGKLLRKNTISNIETIIEMSSLKSSTYFLKISKRESEIKTYKIIKN